MIFFYNMKFTWARKNDRNTRHMPVPEKIVNP